MIQGFSEVINGTETLTQTIFQNITNQEALENVQMIFNRRVEKVVVKKNKTVGLKHKDGEDLFDRVIITATPRAASFIKFEPRCDDLNMNCFETNKKRGHKKFLIWQSSVSEKFAQSKEFKS